MIRALPIDEDMEGMTLIKHGFFGLLDYEMWEGNFNAQWAYFIIRMFYLLNI